MPRPALLSRPLSLAAALAALTACSEPRPTRIDVGYDEASRRVVVELDRALKDGERLHARIRLGAADELDCAAQAAAIERVDQAPTEGFGAANFAGPEVAPELFEPVYDTEWLERPEPSAEMLERIAAGQALIDVCLMKGDAVVREAVFDVRRALDRTGTNGKADGEEEVIASTVAYAERCVDELGEIPFFDEIAAGDYQTFNCLDATPIPTTVTDAEGNVTLPEGEVEQCDNPQYIYSLCEGNAVDGRTNGPRVTSSANDSGTHWVLLCRKARADEGAYNDIAMIGHNPYTGKTCYFQNALYSRTDGLHVPHPGDKVESEASPQQSESLWSGIHGGLGSGIECAKCHDADAFIHTPWIDGALTDSGNPVVPKMGIDPDFVLGYADAPYSIVNAQGQGWDMPRHLVSEEAAACTRCHRIGDGRWATRWIDRLVGENQSWVDITTDAYRSFEHTFWMPPELDGLDESTWPESDLGRAVAFIQRCGRDPDGEGCQWAELPADPLGDAGELPEIELEGAELAREAAMILGADVEDPRCPGGQCASRRCAECHSVSRGGLRRWLDYTDHAWETCGLNGDIGEMRMAEARAAINCLRSDPDDEGSVFAAAKLGILSTGVQYGPFRTLFQNGYRGDAWLRAYMQFKSRVGMPKGSHPKLSQREFAVVQKWFSEDLVAIDEVIEEAPAPTTCEPERSEAALAAHVDEMQFEGWSAINAENGMRMYGCSGQDALSCFSDMPDRSADWAGEGSSVRELTELSFRTSFWTRSSADGRYVGNGGGGLGATITDLLTGTDIPVDASYDPGFFPDNSGFIFQGSVGGAGICPQSVLSEYDEIHFTEPECMSARGINLYQHVARGIGGGDYFVINSQFTSDAGGNTEDPAAFFSASSTMKLTPMVFDGQTYEQMPSVIVDSPYEGDSVLSPSARLVVSRLAGADGKSLGYVLRRVRATRFADSYVVDIGEKLATICMPGAKANISYDERFLVTHHYEGDRANLYLVDLATGTQHQITDVPSGAKALFPHFRSDGWIYFLAEDEDGREYIAASDAALRLAAE